jgi:hypothetical protein
MPRQDRKRSTRDRRDLHRVRDGLNRLSEVKMNASLRHELQMIAFIRGLVERGRLTGEATERVRETRIHMIGAENVMVDLGVASKTNAERDFLEHLRDLGRASADAWLVESYDGLGRRSTVDLEERFLRRTFRRGAGASPLEPAAASSRAGRASGRPT